MVIPLSTQRYDSHHPLLTILCLLMNIFITTIKSWQPHTRCNICFTWRSVEEPSENEINQKAGENQYINTKKMCLTGMPEAVGAIVKGC